MSKARLVIGWLALATVVIIPIAAAATSPLLQWRQPVYIAAGFAGIVAMTLLLLQPLLAGGYLPGLTAPVSRRLHRYIGFTLLLMVVIHVVGLWITSPPDVIDALLFVSPTPFSLWGVIAMWALFASAGLVIFRRTLPLKPSRWRACHKLLAATIVGGSVVHAMLVDGTMEILSKSGLCVLLIAAGLVTLTRSPKA